MSNLFTRLKESIQSDLHELLDKKEQRNPIALLNQHLRRCEQEVEKVRELIQRQYLLKEEFTREYQQAQDFAEKRKYQAEIALKAGENELYEFAAKEQAYYEDATSRLKASLGQANSQLEELEKKYEEMKRKLKEMHIKRMELMGRENIARANYRMNKVLQANDMSKPFSRFEETEMYLNRLEHQVNTSYHRNTIDARIAQLEKELKSSDTNSNS
ncbi:PspA/IM30 family protein [Fictibacillus sp. Mic-4]|uniref:PspA/IM30 family protein n=1 Tax=Fictibacillus sp. Mic-4 TaxID=3132826 RepID=UPI003CEEEEFB